ncbi:uncharacterized protein SPAPADRAFT_62292 [Spathaspora passalidarum NRRL Y-27907]|uniref:Uncharacterized protein n=1 Tax=Spathaspora passalidarum (strain NRRL Y-27907 / 11-Y1) TaxID=619300 RepID=G3AR23_SPAPN|nr:uncharacterized protein SPAPADRAFT_62292 [Spathaspora passalidarum NRRL Y-27907]EGW31684.1 hypothetical protein SPAPADRAFT_62292 [Spathaspora passalidarum NRRL Y-27907]
MVDHPEFSGRARKLKDFREDSMEDYGTKVDGIIGSIKYDISKSCNLLSVKILDKYGERGYK